MRWPGIHRHWLEALVACDEPCVLVAVAVAEGSTPRASGARMLITADRQWGTIGGGHLEWKAQQVARELLAPEGRAPDPASPAPDPTLPDTLLMRFALGPALGQCCGGAATLLFELVGAAKPPWVEAALARRAAGEILVLATPVHRRAAMSHSARHTGSPVTPAAASTRLQARLISRLDVACEGGESDVAHEASGSAQWRATARGLMEAGGPLAVLLVAGGAGLRTGSARAAGEPAATLDAGCPSSGEPGAAGLLLLERIAPDPFEVVVFGAGHVGHALVAALSLLPCRVLWVDARSEVFPSGLPPSVETLQPADPLDEVDRLRPGSMVLVLTHSHALDQDLCERLLRRADTAYLGLIGSATKRATFERRLRQRGIDPASFASLTCPIGISGIGGKEPAVIAAAVVAQLLQVRDAGLPACPSSGSIGVRGRPRHQDVQRIEPLDECRD